MRAHAPRYHRPYKRNRGAVRRGSGGDARVEAPSTHDKIHGGCRGHACLGSGYELTNAGGRRAEGPRAGAQRRSERNKAELTRRGRRPPRRAASITKRQASCGRRLTGGSSGRRRRRRHCSGVGTSCGDPSAVGLPGGGVEGRGGGQRPGWWGVGRPRRADGRGMVNGAVASDARGAGGLSALDGHTCFLFSVWYTRYICTPQFPVQKRSAVEAAQRVDAVYSSLFFELVTRRRAHRRPGHVSRGMPPVAAVHCIQLHPHSDSVTCTLMYTPATDGGATRVSLLPPH